MTFQIFLVKNIAHIFNHVKWLRINMKLAGASFFLWRTAFHSARIPKKGESNLWIFAIFRNPPVVLRHPQIQGCVSFIIISRCARKSRDRPVSGIQLTVNTAAWLWKLMQLHIASISHGCMSNVNSTFRAAFRIPRIRRDLLRNSHRDIEKWERKPLGWFIRGSSFSDRKFIDFYIFPNADKRMAKRERDVEGTGGGRGEDMYPELGTVTFN